MPSACNPAVPAAERWHARLHDTHAAQDASLRLYRTCSTRRTETSRRHKQNIEIDVGSHSFSSRFGSSGLECPTWKHIYVVRCTEPMETHDAGSTGLV